MKKQYLLLVVLSIQFLACQQNKAQQKDAAITVSEEPTVLLLANDKLRYIELSGTPYERGLTHGKLLKKEIQEVIALFKEDIKKTTKQDPGQFIATFLKNGFQNFS